MPFVQTNPIQMLDNTADAFVIREKVGGINYVEIDTINGVEVIRLLPTGIGDIRCFVNSAEGITRYLGISGYKTSGSLAEARLGVGVHTDEVLSIYNAQGYYFDNDVGIGATSISGITNAIVLHVENIGSGTGTHAQIVLEGSSSHTFLSVFSGDNTAGGHPGIMYHSGHSLRFGTADDETATGFVERMRLTDTGQLGIGVTPAQKFEIGSNDNSNRISIYHTDITAIMSWDDGELELRSVESGAHHGIVNVYGVNGGDGFYRAWNATETEYIEMAQEGSTARLHTGGASPGSLRIQRVGENVVTFFDGSPEGVTKYVSISGYKTSGSLTEARLGVGVHTDQVLSIYNAQGYYFDNDLTIGKSSFESWTATYTVLQIGGNAAILADTTEGASKALYVSQNAYHDSNDSRWEAISNDEASMIEMKDGKFNFNVSNGAPAADGAITWVIAYAIRNDGDHYFELKDSATDALTMTEDGNNYLIIDTNTPKMDFGNATDDPAYNFLGSGAVNFHGAKVLHADGLADLTTGYTDWTAADASPDSITGKGSVDLGPTGGTDDTYAFTGMIDGQVVFVYNTGVGTAYFGYTGGGSATHELVAGEGQTVIYKSGTGLLY